MFQRVIQLIKSLYSRHRDQWFDVGGITINLGKGHMLPIYQKSFAFYDQFLPYFVERMSWGGDNLGHWSECWGYGSRNSECHAG